MRSIALLALTAGLASAPAPEAKKDEDLFQGRWKVVAVEHGGKKAQAKDFAKWTLTVAGDKMTARDGDEVMDESTFRLDAKAKPRAIDLTLMSGPQSGKKVLGLYELEGDRLVVCFGEPGKDRPKEVRSPEGSEVTLLRFERVKP